MIDTLSDIQTHPFVYAFAIPIAMFGLLIWFVSIVSRWGSDLAQQKSRIYGTPEPDRLYFGLLLPAPARDTSAQDIAYRKFYRTRTFVLVKRSILIWLGIFALSFI